MGTPSDFPGRRHTKKMLSYNLVYAYKSPDTDLLQQGGGRSIKQRFSMRCSTRTLNDFMRRLRCVGTINLAPQDDELRSLAIGIGRTGDSIGDTHSYRLVTDLAGEPQPLERKKHRVPSRVCAKFLLSELPRNLTAKFRKKEGFCKRRRRQEVACYLLTIHCALVLGHRSRLTTTSVLYVMIDQSSISR